MRHSHDYVMCGIHTGAMDTDAPRLGRPSTYTHDLGDEICRRLGEGESLRSICLDEHMPALSTVMLWIVKNNHADFSERYARAREAQAHVLADEVLAIADDKDADPQRSRLQLDARKWLTSKILPKQYGDKIETEVYGKDGAPLVPTLTVIMRRDKPSEDE
jgi:hypothetical protein